MKTYNKLSYNILAFGVFTLLSLSNADATIIHQDINSPLQYYGTPFSTSLTLDVNSDGVNDLYFRRLSGSRFYHSHNDLMVYGLNGTKVTPAGPLSFGDLIDSSLTYEKLNVLSYYEVHNWYGSWTRLSGSWNNGYNEVTGYLGFALSINDEDLFGWTRLSMNHYGVANFHELAYATTPFAALTAGQTVSSARSAVPEPSSLALLALGAAGVVGIRRRRKAT